MKRQIALLAVLLGLAVILSGCSEYSSSGGDFHAGETLTPARLAEISESIAAGSENRYYDPERDKASRHRRGGKYYCVLTKSGSVWHSARACGSLANSTAVESGTVEQAERAGKSRACQRCGPPGGDTGNTDTAGASEPGES